jgi:hypothetical protein
MPIFADHVRRSMRSLGRRPVQTVQKRQPRCPMSNPSQSFHLPPHHFPRRSGLGETLLSWPRRPRLALREGPSDSSLPCEMCRSVISPWCGGLLLNHAGILKHVGPFPARPLVAVLEMLAEVIRAIKFLGRVALPEFVHVL